MDNNKLQIAYSGVQGAYAGIVASKIFPEGELVSYSSFRQAYEAVEKKECDYAVLPIENSFAGEVAQVTDLLYSGSLTIAGIFELPIVHNILGIEGTDLSRIKTVYSHPQALDQCSEYIYLHGFEKRVATNTAMAAKEVALLEDPTMAAIASKETAQIYGLKILESAINESESNTTRFVVLKLDKETSNIEQKEIFKRKEAFTMILIVKNEAGAVARAITTIGDFGFNMRTLRSRPQKTLLWNYYFYIEGEGDLSTVKGVKMLEMLKENCEMVKVLGNYPADVVFED
ncbi:MAG: bifunctional chorismate mutase/prephenate dehydratase [Lachnospiraceae bacterium]|nr:bifunctional chorismate mutase/prephenate dehydratase [Lachnospiraceae bacterium]